MKNKQVFRITMTALMAAMCYVGFSYIKFDIPVGPTWTTIHLGNTFCALAALLMEVLLELLACRLVIC